MELNALVKSQLEKIRKAIPQREIALGEIIFNNNDCQVLTQSAVSFELLVIQSDGQPVELSLHVFESEIIPERSDERTGWDHLSFACLLQIDQELGLLDPREPVEHKKYSRSGMIRRVLLERRHKADAAEYHIKWASNIYGDHILTNERGVRYTVFLRDFEHEKGYSDSMDSRINKLGTTKHIMHAFSKLKENKSLFDRLDKTFPFIEIYCDPLNDYQISWYYPYTMPVDEHILISRYFRKSKSIDASENKNFLGFLQAANDYPLIRIRPEVQQRVESAFEEDGLEELRKSRQVDHSRLNATLYPYQKEGIEFALFRKTALIADEMGLGKTIQAIGAAIQKKEVFGFAKTLVVCPASLKEQWKKEIGKFSHEKALVVTGFPADRAKQYKDPDHFFCIVNYETIIRDWAAINKAGFDFLVLDEAQRIKNYETKTAGAIGRLQFKHVLVITGTPIENRLIDLFSLVSAIDPWFFGPLWEFSYQHCLFDPSRHDKINGYYDLQKLNKKLEPILLRREKRKVINQLPNVQQIDVPLNLSPLQAQYHAGYANGIAKIISKKFLTPFDLQRLQILLANMRMVCDSTYLIDDETNESPKLDELRHILLEKLDVPNSNRKIIIFSEWVKVHKLIGQMLRENNIGFAELNGKVPVNLRGELIRKFETNTHCKIFLSTEAGGTGLNLQAADTVINFELPWNPAKKNQRIGRIDRLGQKSDKLTIFNFITRNSIETQIASGLLVKQSLFDGVLDSANSTNFVDFSTKGRSQFIQQLEEFISTYGKEEETPETSAGPDELTGTTTTTPELPGIIDPVEEPQDFRASQESSLPGTTDVPAGEAEKIQQIEQVMNSGMQFLAGLFKMSTGKDLGIQNQTVEVNRETGEVVMKFRLPV